MRNLVIVCKKYSTAVLAIASFAITLAVYWKCLGYDFVNWDDTKYVTENPFIRSFSLRNIITMLTGLHFGFWIPVTWLSFASDYFIFGLNPKGFHLTNIIIHSLNSILVFFTASFFLKKRLPATDSKTASFFCALMWALHPLRVESVVWISERKDLLSGFFFLTALIIYLYHKQITGKILSYIFFFFLLSVISKPISITFPVILLLIDMFFLKKRKLSTLYLLPFFSVSLFSTIITTYSHHKINGISSVASTGIALKVLCIFKNIWFYISKTIWPKNLLPLYPFPLDINLTTPSFLTGFILTLIISTVAALLFLKGKKDLFLIWSSYLIIISPVIGIVQIGRHCSADRFSYLATVTFYILFTFALIKIINFCSAKANLHQKWINRLFILKLILFTIITGTLTYLSLRQMPVWQSPLSLYKKIIFSRPESAAFAHNNLSLIYESQGKTGLAIAELNKSIKLDQNNSAACINLGHIYQKLGNNTLSLKYYKKAYHINPRPVEAELGLGIIYYKMGQFNKSLEILKNCIKDHPGNVKAHFNLGNVYYKQNRFKEALISYRNALKSDPDHFNSLVCTGLVFVHFKEYRKAEIQYMKALDIRPDNAGVYTNLGLMYLKSDQLKKGRVNF
ncbi:MAG: tetratricopeptide repeat protein [bacterium]|nr:tetratricopeptide repeat protein [bacterium]